MNYEHARTQYIYIVYTCTCTSLIYNYLTVHENSLYRLLYITMYIIKSITITTSNYVFGTKTFFENRTHIYRNYSIHFLNSLRHYDEVDEQPQMECAKFNFVECCKMLCLCCVLLFYVVASVSGAQNYNEALYNGIDVLQQVSVSILIII